MLRLALLYPMAALAQLAAAGLYPGAASANHRCPSDPVLSCPHGPKPDRISDACCTETSGGLVVATQIWNTFTGLEGKGQVYPRGSWTIHGLWPDFCNGSYTQYCDLSRQYDPRPVPNTTDGKPHGTPVPPYTGEPIDRWFKPCEKQGMLAFMNKYWVSQFDPNWVFWAHEFSKHATCFSTFQKECYSPQAPEHADLFEFFETAIAFHDTLPTFRWLSETGIKPSNKTGFSLPDLQHALTNGFGLVPFVGCSGPRYNETAAGKGSADNGRTQLSEVWYFYHVYGRPQDARRKKLPADVAGGRLSTCANAPGAVWYYERARGSEE